jgi:hypothetical protein
MGEMGSHSFQCGNDAHFPISYVELHCLHQNNLQTDFTETSIEVNFSIETLET